jgi:hypothetical protein
MKIAKSPWILGLLYIKPEDPRIFVPLPCKLGLALNFGNPRVVPGLAWLAGLVLLGLFAVPLLAAPLVFGRHPTTPFMWLLAWLGAFAAIRLNFCFRWSDFREISLAGYGLVAFSIGMGVQSIILGPLVWWWGGRNNLTWAHGFIVGPICALAQTFGKWAAIVLLRKVRPAASPLRQLRQGLLVGLGFTVYEVAIVFLPAAWTRVTLGQIAVWERVSVSLFHIYSAGLVALALWSGRRWLIVFVVAMHSAMDWLAVATRSLSLSFQTVEIMFSILAVITWGTFLLAARDSRSGDGLHSGVNLALQRMAARRSRLIIRASAAGRHR